MSTAWILDLGGERRMAVAQRQQLHLMHEPQTQTLAFAPAHAQHLLLWSARCVPVVDFGSWCQGEATPAHGLLGVYAYVDEAGSQHQFGALWLASPPVRVEVDDAQGCELPPELEGWRGFSLSCFRDERFGSVPVVDLARIFEAPRSAPSAAPDEPSFRH